MMYQVLIRNRTRSVRLGAMLAFFTLFSIGLAACEAGAVSPAETRTSRPTATVDDRRSGSNPGSSNEQQAGGDAAAATDGASDNGNDSSGSDGGDAQPGGEAAAGAGGASGTEDDPAGAGGGDAQPVDDEVTGADGEPDEPAGLDYALRLDGETWDVFEAAYLRSAWKKNLESGLAESACPPVQPLEYPEGYYTGPLIDTHLHMPQLSDEFGDGDDRPDTGGGVDSELYDAIAETDRPLLGVTVTVDEIACTLKHEGTVKAFTFFPVFQDAPAALIDAAYRTEERHGSLFVPFIQSTNSQISGVEGGVLQQMLELRPNLFAGLGEIGDSPTEPINLPPDDPFYTGAFEVARSNGLHVYFHPGEGDHENLDRALKLFPDVNFIVHADFVRPYIGDLMASNPNVYYTFNDIFDEVTPMFRFGDKQDFIDAMERDWDQLLDQAMVHYEDLINQYPDRFMWGTDRADIVWNYHSDIGQLLAKFGRAFIGRLDPAVQEQVGYLNAEQLLNSIRP